MKLIDFDGMFDEKLAEYMEMNEGKHTEKQWESVIPKLYKSFGDTFIKSVGNTPKGFYRDMTDEELVTCLKEHVEKGVPVSDFLCRELEERKCPDELIKVLDSAEGELLTLAVNVAGSNEKAFPSYLKILLASDDEEIKDTVAEQLKANPDPVSAEIKALYREGKEKELMLEIMSRCKNKEDEIYNILLNELLTDPDNMPMHAAYIAAYGDKRALEPLFTLIDGEVNYLEYQELKYAIEALGGEYNKIRDFSDDPYYREIVEQSQMMPDFAEEGKTQA